MILTVTLNAAIDKRYVVENFEEGEVNIPESENIGTSLGDLLKGVKL